MAGSPMKATRAQILGFRRASNGLDERLAPGRPSFERAAWAGLQDSMPRAALLSIHARVEGTKPTAWEDPPLVQVWGPRFSAYVVAERDVALFTLGRMPTDGPRQRLGADLAERLATFLGGRRMPYSEAGRALGVAPNQLRYAAPTGTVLIRWEGAGKPVIWTVPAPDISPDEALVSLARRFLHVFGPATSVAFSHWAGIKPRRAAEAFDLLGGSLTPIRTPIGDAWLLDRDTDILRGGGSTPAPARLLPSGDTYFLTWGAERELLVTEPDRRNALWTSRVWPGALLVEGEIVGVWRRARDAVTIEPWRRLSRSVRDAVESEAAALPVPGVERGLSVTWQ